MTQRRFEGSTLAEVLAKVQKEMGPDAHIVNAQKTRSGGIFGFFQREKFVVTVDPSKSSEATGESATVPSPASIMELAEQINEQETAAEPEESVKAEIVEHEREQRPISTETDSFAEVLSRMAFQADMTSEPKSEEGNTVLDTDTEQPESEIEVSVDDRPAFLDTPPAPPAPPASTVKTPSRVVPPFRTRISDHPLATLGLPVAYIPAGVELSQLQKALATTLERLPQPPTIKPSKGTIIAVVGEIVEALELAEELARKWRRPIEEVVLASQYYKGRGASSVLRNVQSAGDAQRSWSRRPRPTIVAIDAYPGSRDTAWAEHMLTALEPVATYGVADATRKAEDIATWAAQLGGIDCLAVNHLEETVSPASILATGIPVERIDGRVATPAYWAMLLTERLTAA